MKKVSAHLKSMMPKLVYVVVVYSLLTLGSTWSYFSDVESTAVVLTTFQDPPVMSTMSRSVHDDTFEVQGNQDGLWNVSVFPRELGLYEPVTINVSGNASVNVSVFYQNATWLCSCMNGSCVFVPRDIGLYTVRLGMNASGDNGSCCSFVVVDRQPPVIGEMRVVNGSENLSFEFGVNITDDYVVVAAVVEVWVDDVQYCRVNLSEEGNDSFEGVFDVPVGWRRFSYVVVAWDASENMVRSSGETVLVGGSV